jgi:apolipoprotein N-acyltransferase
MLLAASLGILAFPPVGIWPLSYVAMVPFLDAARQMPPRQAWKWGYWSGFVFFSGLLYWIGLNSGAPLPLSMASMIALVAILATIWGLSAWAVSRAAIKFSLLWVVALFVFVYVFQEVWWGTGELSFPWAVWGLTQIGFLPAAQIADVVDIFGLSSWVLVINGLLFLIWRFPPWRKRAVVLAVVVFLIPLMYGFIRIATFHFGPPVAVAAVQASTPAEEKWQMGAEDILDEHLRISQPLAATDVQLIVWPETATPMPLRFRVPSVQKIQNFVDSSGSALITGATDYENDRERGLLPYNAAFLFRPGTRELLSSAKIHLVPFGERIPWQSTFPFLGRIRLGQAEFQPGKGPVVYPASANVPPMGCLICFEVLFPEIAGDLVTGGAQILTHLTNDGWYGNTSGPYQHLELTRLRAIAARRSIVRAANTGVSALIDPTGHVQKRLGYNGVGFIEGTLPAQTQVTLAVRFSRIWLPFYAGLLLAILIALYLKSRGAPYVRAL